MRCFGCWEPFNRRLWELNQGGSYHGDRDNFDCRNLLLAPVNAYDRKWKWKGIHIYIMLIWRYLFFAPVIAYGRKWKWKWIYIYIKMTTEIIWRYLFFAPVDGWACKLWGWFQGFLIYLHFIHDDDNNDDINNYGDDDSDIDNNNVLRIPMMRMMKI